MKHYLVFIPHFLFAFCLTGCCPEPETVKKQSEDLPSWIKARVIKIEECEYWYGTGGNIVVLTHKGNCNNPIHIYNGENNE
jgi:hypothetical protein